MKSFDLNLRNKSGYLFGIGFCIATAISLTMIHETSVKFDPFFSLFLTTLLGILSFNLLCFKSLKTTYQTSFNEKYLWVVISLSVAGNWGFTFLSLSKINSFLFIFTYFSASSIIATAFDYIKKKALKDFIFIFLMTFFLVIFFSYLKLKNHTPHLFLGGIEAILSAFFGYLYRRYSVLFSQKTHLVAIQVLSVRFYLLLLIALIFLNWHEFQYLNFNALLQFVLLTVVSFLIPLFCMQKSVLLIGAEKFSVLTAMCPLVTAVLLLCMTHHTSGVYFILSVLIFGCTVCKTITNS